MRQLDALDTAESYDLQFPEAHPCGLFQVINVQLRISDESRILTRKFGSLGLLLFFHSNLSPTLPVRVL